MQAIIDISSIAKRLTIYELTANKFPDTLVEVNQGGLLDPWGNPYHYLNLSKIKRKGKPRKNHKLVLINSDFDLYSAGKDGSSVGPLTAKTSRDNIVRANNGRFIGRTSDY